MKFYFYALAADGAGLFLVEVRPGGRCLPLPRHPPQSGPPFLAYVASLVASRGGCHVAGFMRRASRDERHAASVTRRASCGERHAASITRRALCGRPVASVTRRASCGEHHAARVMWQALSAGSGEPGRGDGGGDGADGPDAAARGRRHRALRRRARVFRCVTRTNSLAFIL